MAVWLCSGQGAQACGMGADLLANDDYRELEEVFETASRIMGVDLRQVACEGSEDVIQDPYNAQALTVALSVGIGRELLARGCEPEALVGFSLGQVSALALSGMLSDEDAFSLLRARAAAMAKACESRPGAMTALLKATHEEAEALCVQCACGQVLVPANYNCPGQVVISGEIEAIERAEAAWSAIKGKRASRLRTAGGFHSPLMEEAAKATGDAARALVFCEPRWPVICNTDASSFCAAEAAARMEKQVKSPVLFEQSVQSLIERGSAEFVEIGFGGVLANLVRRIDRGVARTTIGTAEELEAFLGAKGKES